MQSAYISFGLRQKCRGSWLYAYFRDLLLVQCSWIQRSIARQANYEYERVCSHMAVHMDIQRLPEVSIQSGKKYGVL